LCGSAPHRTPAATDVKDPAKSIRFVILLVFLAVVVVVLQADRQQLAQTGPGQGPEVADTMTKQERAQVQVPQKILQDLPLPGEEPTVLPESHVEVRVDTSDSKNRLQIIITEAHGCFAETFRLASWTKGHEQRRWDHFVNRCLPERGALVVKNFVVPAALQPAGGDRGRTGGGEAEVVEHTRGRAENPPNWPPRARTTKTLRLDSPPGDAGTGWGGA